MVTTPMRMRIEYDGIDSREAIDDIQRRLEAMETVEVHTIGLNLVDVSYDEHAVALSAMEQVISENGGSIRETHRQS